VARYNQRRERERIAERIIQNKLGSASKKLSDDQETANQA